MEPLNLALRSVHGQRVYVDTNVFIYFLEQSPTFGASAKEVLSACARQEVLGVTGQAAVAEVMFGMYKPNHPNEIARARAFFDQPEVFQVVDHTGENFDLAAQLGARDGIKLIDALHIATAIHSGCTALITNDSGIRTSHNLQIIGL